MLVRRSLLPGFVDHGFVRDDCAEEYEREGRGTWLRAARPPAVGQHVKAQLVFRRPMKNGVCGEPATTWCLMGGRVVGVVGDAHVTVDFSPSTLNAPLPAEGNWRATLALDFEWDFPWVLVSMTKIPWPKRPTSTRAKRRRTRAAEAGAR